MRRPAPLMTALVSLLVLTSYVAAAFVDCERPKGDAVRQAARLAAVGPQAAHGAPGTSRHGAMSGSDMTVEGARAATPPGPPEVVLAPTCLCGCSETRALVGGSLARLGATIPAVYVAVLPPAVVIDGRPPVGGAESASFVVDDPVPI